MLDASVLAFLLIVLEDLGFYKGECPIPLKGAPKAPMRWSLGRGCAPPQKFLYFLYRNGEFLFIPGDICE